MDFRAIIGSAADDPQEKSEGLYNEMELLANMVFRNYKDSLKIILPHVVVKAFLDLKWKKFRSSVFFYTAFYVLMHLWYTCFVIQVFIVRYPFRPAPAETTSSNGTAVNGSQEEEKLTFFGYIRGNWKAVPPHVVIDETNPLPPMLYEQGIALMVIGSVLLLIEAIECFLILKVAIYSRNTNLHYRYVFLSFLLIGVAIYNENTEAIIVALGILLLHIYDEINTQIGRMRYGNVTCQLEPMLLLLATVVLYLMAIFRSLLYYDVVATGAVGIFNFVVFILTFFGGKYGMEESPNKGSGCTKNLISSVVSFLRGVKYFFNRMSAYLANVENILQLVFITLMIGVSSVICQKEISSWYYLCAAFSVVLAWTLILMQIGNIYGIGVYVQIFKTVLKRFLYVMSTYSVMLIAFSIAFSIIFPGEKLFVTLPASFFRVVSMMVGELNFDDIFNKDGAEETLRAFPYATQWIHTGFIVSVTVVLVNLLIGLTVSDIEKISEISDVIHRTIQIERLYIMERLYLDVPLFRLLNRGNIYVIPQKERTEGQGLELRVGIKELPKALHKEIRLLAENPVEYTKTYLQK